MYFCVVWLHAYVSQQYALLYEQIPVSLDSLIVHSPLCT